MKKKKISHITRKKEALRQNSAYDYYNSEAALTIKNGGLLTILKSHIAQKFDYKSYQSVANLVSRRDNLRRIEIINFFNSLSTELFVPIESNTENKTTKIISIRNKKFIFYLTVVLTYECFPAGNGFEYGIKSKEVTFHSAFNNKKIMFFNQKDVTEINNFFNSKIIFDIIPTMQEEA